MHTKLGTVFIRDSQTNIKLSPVPKATTAILFHTKVYVLADRFNITKLKDLAFSKVTTLFVDLGMVADKPDVDAVMEAIAYAYDKLPLSHGPLSLHNLNLKERLLVYMARYTAWARDSLQTNKTLMNLLGDCPEFAVALLFSSRTASTPPWIAEQIDSATADSSKWAVSHDSTSHILSRSCRGCSYKGIMAIWCTSCKKYDHEVGSQIVICGTTVGELGTDRLSGTKSIFTYTCKWCGYKQTCNNISGYYSEPITGGGYNCVTSNGSLVCRKCNTNGCRGLMSVI